MFRELWKEIPFGFRAFFVVCMLAGLAFVGFQVWAIVSLVGLAGDAVQAIGQ